MSRHVIQGTCPICGAVRGTVGRPLSRDERYGLLDAGYKLASDVFDRDIASQDGVNFNDGLSIYHLAGHPKPQRETRFARVLGDLSV